MSRRRGGNSGGNLRNFMRRDNARWLAVQAAANEDGSSGDRFETGGGGHVTVNPTDDPRVGANGYYVSVGEGEKPNETHSTAVFNADGTMADVQANRGWITRPRQNG